MRKLLIVGCGDIGGRVARLLGDRVRLLGLARSPASAARLRAAGIGPVAGDLDRPETLRRVAGLADAVLHLAPPAPAGATDPRTRHLLAALARGKSLPQRLVYISTSGVYGDCGGARVNESRPAAPGSDRAQRRRDAERQLRAFAARHRVRLTILRVPGIYAADRLPLERLRQGAPMPRTEDDAWTNHIHADDLARALVAALWRGNGGRCFNIVDDDHHKMADYFDLIADFHRLPRPPRLPRDEVARQVSPAMWSYLAESRRLDNDRMKRELRLGLKYPTVQSWLDTL